MILHPTYLPKSASIIVPLLVVAATAGAWPAPNPAVRYALSANATYQEGCFDPCLCPILMATEVEGTFLLTRVESAGTETQRSYEVTGISWTVPTYDGSQHAVSGQGSYLIDPVANTQRMVLDLQIDDQEVQHFDSQVVEVRCDWPSIEVLVSIHQLFCYDVVFQVDAMPVGPVAVAQSHSWGTVKRFFVR